MSAWNPVTHPFRVVHHMRSSQPGCFGWVAPVIGTYSTLAEAEAAAAPIRPSIKVVIDEAQNAEDWSRRGRWKRVRTIKPRAKVAP